MITSISVIGLMGVGTLVFAQQSNNNAKLAEMSRTINGNDRDTESQETIDKRDAEKEKWIRENPEQYQKMLDASDYVPPLDLDIPPTKKISAPSDDEIIKVSIVTVPQVKLADQPLQELIELNSNIPEIKELINKLKEEKHKE